MSWLIDLIAKIILGILGTPAKETKIEKAGTDIDYKPDAIDVDFYGRMLNRS